MFVLVVVFFAVYAVLMQDVTLQVLCNLNHLHMGSFDHKGTFAYYLHNLAVSDAACFACIWVVINRISGMVHCFLVCRKLDILVPRAFSFARFNQLYNGAERSLCNALKLTRKIYDTDQNIGYLETCIGEDRDSNQLALEV